MIELRPYQNECIEVIEAAEKNGTNRQLVALPTGTGKTVIFCELAKKRNGRTLILADPSLRSPTTSSYGSLRSLTPSAYS